MMIIQSKWSRRRWLSTALAATGAPVLAGVGKPITGLKTVSIFHTTDLHGHILPTQTYQGLGNVGGFARCAAQIRKWKQESPHHLLVDLGDVYQGTAASLESQGQIMMELFNKLNYDAWVIGNHDLDWGRQVVETSLGNTAGAVLTGNLTVDGRAPADVGGPWAKVKPWMMKEVNGLKIALIGLTTPGMPMWLPPETLGGIAVQDPVETLRNIMAEVKAENPNAIILLGHMGWKFQDDSDNPVRTLLQENRDIDIYLGGHSHQDQPDWKLNGVQCSQANYFGIHCGRVDLHFHEKNGKLFDARAFTVMMDDRFEPDPEVVQLAAPLIAKTDAELARVLCTVKSTIEGKGRGSALANMLCSTFASVLEKSGKPVDGVFHGTFGTGDIEPGELSVSDAWKILPYENLLITCRLTGEEILSIIEEDETIKSSDRTFWGFELEKDPRGNVLKFLHRGNPVALTERKYNIAMNSYDSQSGGGRLNALHTILQNPECKRTMTNIDARSALIGYLSEAKVLGE